ncbi:MAG TPA: glycine cleavage system protein GcvH [Spirochaetota bacterium]|nr:glycine cleavage system protein GcvH [Spirochaetota bacterium]
MEVESLKYSKEHLWIHIEGDTAKIGITDYAQNELGDVVFIEIPEKGKKVKKGDVVGSIESVKSVSDIVTPLSGEVVEANTALEDVPDTVNKDPYSDGWIFAIKIENKDEVAELLDYAKYNEHTEAEMA